jgi:hypothetical protein
MENYSRKIKNLKTKIRKIQTFIKIREPYIASKLNQH